MKKHVKYFFICLIVTLVSCKSIQLRNEIDNYYQKNYSVTANKSQSKFRNKAITTFLEEFNYDFTEFVIIEEYEPNSFSPPLGMTYRVYFVVGGKVMKGYVSGDKEKFEEDFSFHFLEEDLYNYEQIIYSKLVKGENSELIDYHKKDEGGISERAFVYATQIDKSLKIINGVKFTQFYFSKEYYENKILKE